MKLNKNLRPDFCINFSLDWDAIIIAEKTLSDPNGNTSYLVFDIKTLEKVQEVEVCLVDKTIPSKFTGVPENIYEERYTDFMSTPYSANPMLSKVVSWHNGDFILCPVY